MIGARAFLFVPTIDRRRWSRAHEREADVVILDLEDGVPRDAKAEARALLPSAVAHLRQHGSRAIVRINCAWWDVVEDLKAVRAASVETVMVPKVEDPGRLRVIGEMMAQTGMIDPSILALIETPLGLQRLEDVAAAPNVAGLALGVEDFAAALGVAPSEDLLDMPCRRIAVAAAAAGVAAIAAPTSLSRVDDVAGFEAAVRRARGFGATGALCVHPRQVAAAKAAFSPAPAEVAWAEALLHAAEQAGPGVFRFDGRMIDLPVLEQARRLLAGVSRSRA